MARFKNCEFLIIPTKKKSKTQGRNEKTKSSVNSRKVKKLAASALLPLKIECMKNLSLHCTFGWYESEQRKM